MVVRFVNNDFYEVKGEVEKSAIKRFYPKKDKATTSTNKVNCETRIEIKLRSNFFQHE